MTFTYCVWYRLREPGNREAETVIRSMLARLACRTGITGRLLKKRDAPDTWMELYPDVTEPARFEPALTALAEQYDIEMFLADRRHVECFQDEPAVGPPPCDKEKG